MILCTQWWVLFLFIDDDIKQTPIPFGLKIDFGRFAHFASKFFETKWSQKCVRRWLHYYTNTTPILPVQRPILFHSVSLECICNLGWPHSIHTPRCWGCQIRCIGVGRRREAILNEISHIAQKASPPWCITWQYQPCNKQYQLLQHAPYPKILCWIHFWGRRGLNINGYGSITTWTQYMRIRHIRHHHNRPHIFTPTQIRCHHAIIIDTIYLWRRNGDLVAAELPRELRTSRTRCAPACVWSACWSPT